MPSTNGTTRPPVGEQGSFGTHELLTTDKGIFSRDEYLGGVEKRPTVLELETMFLRDSQARGLQSVLTLPVSASTFRIEEARGDKGEAELAREVFLKTREEGGMSTDISLIVAQMCTAFAYRRAFFEKVWTIREGGRFDGAVVYDKLAFRRASTCEILTDPRTKAYAGFRQEGYSPSGELYEKDYPLNKALVYVHGASPTHPNAGESAFEAAYQDHRNKQKLKLLYFMYLQKFGIPPVAGKTDDPTREGQENYHKKIEALQSGSTATFGPGEEVPGTVTAAQTVGGAAGGSADFREAFRYIDSQMATSMLAGFLQLPVTNQTGSYALHKDSTDLYLLSCEARQGEIEAVLNRAMADLIYQNFGKNAAYPRFKMTALSMEHEARALDLLKALYATGNAAPIPVHILNLIRDKGLARIDINQDAIQAAEEEAKEALENPEGSQEGSQGGSQNGEDGLSSAVGRLFGGQAQVAASEDVEDIYELVYNPQKQVRGPDGKFAGSASGGNRQKNKSAVGGKSSIFAPYQRKEGQKGRASAKTAPKPPSNPVPDLPGAQKGKKQGLVIGLPEGEQVQIHSKAQVVPHYTVAGLRGGAASASFFLAIVQGRELTQKEVSFIAGQIGGGFDSSTPACVGKFDPENGELGLAGVSQVPKEEFDAILMHLRTLYGGILGRLLVDGKEISLNTEQEQEAQS